MLNKKVLIAFAFVAITVNTAHGAPIDTPLPNVQGLVPSLTNLDSLQGLSTQTLSSLSSDDKKSPLSLDDLDSKLSSSTQSLPLQSLPVGDDSGDKTSDLDVNNINHLLSSDALSSTQSSTNNNAQRRDDTTGQSDLIPNTDSLQNSITKILSSINPSNLGGQSEKSTGTETMQNESFLRRAAGYGTGGFDGNVPPMDKVSKVRRADKHGATQGNGHVGARSFLPRAQSWGIKGDSDKPQPGKRSFLPRSEPKIGGDEPHLDKTSFSRRAEGDGTVVRGRHGPQPDERSFLSRSDREGVYIGGGGKLHPDKRGDTRGAKGAVYVRPHPGKRSEAIRSRDETVTRGDSRLRHPDERSIIPRAQRAGVKGGGGNDIMPGKRSFLRRAAGYAAGGMDGNISQLDKVSKPILPRDETSSPTDSLSQVQLQQITSQIMDSINEAMPIGSLGDMTSPTSTSATTSTTNDVLPNVRRDDTPDQSNLVPNTDSLRDSITKILSSLNLSNVEGKSSDSSPMPSQNSVSSQKRSMGSEEDLYKRLSMDWFSTKPKQPTVKKDRREENTLNGLTSLQNEQITNQIRDQIKQLIGGMNV